MITTLLIAIPALMAHPDHLGDCLGVLSLTGSNLGELSDQSSHQICISQVENINPQLEIVEPKPDRTVNSLDRISSTSGSNLENESPPEHYNPFYGFTPKSLSTDNTFKIDNSGQGNQHLEVLFSFEGWNHDLFHLKTGFDRLEQPKVEPVNNIPFELGWSRQIKPVTLEISGSLDYFDRLSASPGFHTKVQYPVFAHVNSAGQLQSLLSISGEIDHSIYKVNPKALENGISYWQFQPSMFWQMTPDTTLFTLGQVGKFSDGNIDVQSFTRFEHQFDQLQNTIGKFSVATNLFTWSFQQNLGPQNGYFSPPDFLVYTVELGWSKQLTPNFSCGLNFSGGQQRSSGKFVQARSLQSNCKIKISKQTDLSLGYGRSNVANSNGGAGIMNQSFSGNLSVSF